MKGLLIRYHPIEDDVWLWVLIWQGRDYDFEGKLIQRARYLVGSYGEGQRVDKRRVKHLKVDNIMISLLNCELITNKAAITEFSSMRLKSILSNNLGNHKTIILWVTIHLQLIINLCLYQLLLN